MATLHVLQGPDKGRTYQTGDEPSLIGRSSDQIQLTDNSASRHHAEIRPDNGAWVLADLNSSNGTFLNGQRIVSPTLLRHGDQIKVGSSLMVFTGQEQVESVSGTQRIRDLVDLDFGSEGIDSSILSAVPTSEDSVILQPPRNGRRRRRLEGDLQDRGDDRVHRINRRVFWTGGRHHLRSSRG